MTHLLEAWQSPGLGELWMWTSAQSADDTSRYGWLEYTQRGRVTYDLDDGQTHYGVSGKTHYAFTDEDV